MYFISCSVLVTGWNKGVKKSYLILDTHATGGTLMKNTYISRYGWNGRERGQKSWIESFL